MVARERFELSSEAPEAPMLGHYTTGLPPSKRLPRFFTYNLNVALRVVPISLGFFDAVAFLANHVPVATAPERIHNRVLILPVPRGTEHLVWVLVGVVAVAVPTEPFLRLRFFHSLRPQTLLNTSKIRRTRESLV